MFRKYATIAALIVGGTLLVSGLVQGYFAFQERQAALLAIQQVEARAAAGRIAGFLDEMERQVGAVARSARPAGGAGADTRLLDYFRLLRLEPAIAELAYLDASGRERLRVSMATPTLADSARDHSDAPAFQEARVGGTYLSPVYFRTEYQPFLTFAVAEEGPLGGVTVAEVNLQIVGDVVSRIAVGRSGYAYVVDERGRLLAHPDRLLVLQRTDLSLLPHVQAAMGGSGGQAGFARDPQGRQVLSTYETVPATDWLVFVEQPAAEALAPLYAMVMQTVLLLTSGVALAIAASVLLVRRMVKPIQALQAAAAHIGAGALDQRIELHTRDELEALAGSFNQMAAQLRESYAVLERRVEDRTRQLAEASRDAQEARALAEEANRAKSAFLAGTSHELRTPLNAIIGYSEMLQEEASDLGQHAFIPDLQKINTAGRHLLALINDLLDLSKVEAGRMDLYLETFDVNALIQDIMALLPPLLEKNGNTLRLICAQDLGAVYADRTKVRQSLFNLLSNASKFTEHGAVTLDVAREAGVRANWLRFRVADTGIGMTHDQMRRLFEPFSQADASISSQYGGTGLGLALTRSFCELMGGEVTVESEYGKGSVFTIRLPSEVKEPEPATRVSGRGL